MGTRRLLAWFPSLRESVPTIREWTHRGGVFLISSSRRDRDGNKTTGKQQEIAALATMKKEVRQCWTRNERRVYKENSRSARCPWTFSLVSKCGKRTLAKFNPSRFESFEQDWFIESLDRDQIFTNFIFASLFSTFPFILLQSHRDHTIILSAMAEVKVQCIKFMFLFMCIRTNNLRSVIRMHNKGN